MHFDPRAALKRLENIGDLFGPVNEIQQSLPADLAHVIAEQNKREARGRRSLHAYEAKRNFNIAGEPLASVPRRSTQGSRRRFCVQKHAASHLHYDFRLEIGGALKSWAVPKGIPFEPGVRRLASATEDHPLDYLTFEGVIPQGQYGGGTVMVWDVGTYEIVEGNYWKGNLELSLKGKKLQGEWSLRRDHSKGETAWILEKIGSAMKPISGSKDDRSALSRRTMTDIAESRDAVWQTNRRGSVAGAQQTLQSEVEPIDKFEFNELPRSEPAYIEPMQAKLVDKLPEGKDWVRSQI